MNIKATIRAINGILGEDNWEAIELINALLTYQRQSGAELHLDDTGEDNGLELWEVVRSGSKVRVA